MRIYLLLYVIVFITINFFIESFSVLFLAVTTYPIAIYLLLKKPANKEMKQQELVQLNQNTFEAEA